MKSITTSPRRPGAAFFSARLAGIPAGKSVEAPDSADRTTRITISFDVPNAELAGHLNTCALLDIVHARRRRELGSILGGALRRLVPHYANYSVAPASPVASPLATDRRAA